MFNILNFKDGSILWISEAEMDYINHKLLNGERFFDIPRTGKTYNSDIVSSVGPHRMFSQIENATFRFTDKNVFARTTVGISYVYSGGEWVPTLDTDFDSAKDFEDYLK